MTLREYIDTIKNKKVAVIGIGVSNTPLIDRLLSVPSVFSYLFPSSLWFPV